METLTYSPSLRGFTPNSDLSNMWNGIIDKIRATFASDDDENDEEDEEGEEDDKSDPHWRTWYEIFGNQNIYWTFCLDCSILFYFSNRIT